MGNVKRKAKRTPLRNPPLIPSSIKAVCGLWNMKRTVNVGIK